MELVHPGCHDLVGVLVGGELGLAVDHTLEFDARDGFVDGLEGDAERALRHARAGVLGRAEEITLGEIDRDAVGDWVLGFCAEDSVLRLEEIHDNLEVGRVVARVGEDEDGINLDLAEISWVGGCPLFSSEVLTQWRDGCLGSVDVVGDHNVLEAILLGDFSALVVLSSDDQNSLVVLSKSGHGRVGLNELLGRNWVLENLGELGAASDFRLARPIGEEDVRNFDAELVVSVQDLEYSLAFWNQTITVDKDTVNVECECHILSSSGLAN